MLVPAHNEENGIRAAVQALLRQDYPRDRLQIVVIADNCTDDTAAIAQAAGAQVWDRDDPEARGKGQALGWAIERLQDQRPRVEIVVVVDADCIASANLCSVIVEDLADPSWQAVQVSYEVSNAEDSSTAALRAAGFALKHVIRARARNRLGLSCGLFGTGMAFRIELFDRVQWPTSVTEDTELHLLLVRNGIRVRYAERASVRSPMPVTATAAAEQQLRWESGNAQLAESQLARLILDGVVQGDIQLLGAAADLLLPSQTILASASIAVGAVSAALGGRRLPVLSAVTLTAQGTYVLGGLLAAGATRSTLRALTQVPAFAAGRLRVLFKVASGRRAQTWVRTAREQT